jgi:hypothetical protein
MYNDLERRKYKRIDRPFVVKFRVRPDEPLEKDSSCWDIVAVGDLGPGGVLFNYNKKLGIGTHIDLKIGFSVTKPPINCVGKIIRNDELEYHSMFRVATKFTEIGKRERELINKTIEDIEKFVWYRNMHLQREMNKEKN